VEAEKMIKAGGSGAMAHPKRGRLRPISAKNKLTISR
jgi:hypothetical protein